MCALFDYYAKKLKELNQDVPKIFKQTAKKGAIFFVKKATEITDQEQLVDTGNYWRGWHAEAVEVDDETHAISAINPVEYASHLEYGHRMRNGKIWKGRFVGRRALDETAYYCVQQLDNALDKAYKQM